MFVNHVQVVSELTMSSGVLLYCQYCGTDRVNFDTKYVGDENEIYEYVVCGVCRDLVASSRLESSVDRNENATTSYCQYDQGASGDQNENVIDISDVCCEIDLTDDDGDARCTNEPLSLSPNHHQRLTNSSSAFNFQENRHVSVPFARSATLDDGELSRDSLKQARDFHCRSLSCSSCTSPGLEMLPVKGMTDVFYCSGCLELHGVDDSVNYYDLLQKGDYAVEACVNCGNTDPNFFLLEYGSDPDSISLRCVKCRDTLDGGVEAMVDENSMEKSLKEWIHYECKCKNTNSDLQRFSLDPDSNTIFVKCWSCQREDMITLDRFKPKTCSCDSDEFTDVRFDEFGYALQVVCLKCGAEMHCGASDVRAAGDGTSTGRTHISSPCDIQIGDHIAWHQLLAYWHHAIVTDVNGAEICVVHYNGPSLPNKGMLCS